MEIRPHRTIKRRKTKKIKVGNIFVGGDSIISVQSMTNTITSDISSTVKQIIELENAGADIVRVSCPDENSTSSLKDIVKESLSESKQKLSDLERSLIEHKAMFVTRKNVEDLVK